MNSLRLMAVAGGLVLTACHQGTTWAQVFRSPTRVASRTPLVAQSPSGSGVLQPVPAPSETRPLPPITSWGDPLMPSSEPIISDPLMPYDSYSMCTPDGCPPSGPNFRIFAEALYLRPGNAEVAYAVEQLGCGPTATPTGPVGDVSPDAEWGFRAGLGFGLRPDGLVQLSYAWYENAMSDSITAADGTVLGSLVTYPTLPSCGGNSLSASAEQTVSFQVVDFDYRGVFYAGCNRELYYLAGARWGQLEQQFSASQITGVSTGLSTVNTNLSLDGVGLSAGVGGERLSDCCGLWIYGRGLVSLLGAKADLSYRQTNQFGGAIPVSLQRDDYRLVPVLEAELGIGWTSSSRRWRISAGYEVDAWFNVPVTQEWIAGAHSGVAESLGDTLTFDGLVARFEYRR